MGDKIIMLANLGGLWYNLRLDIEQVKMEVGYRISQDGSRVLK